MKVVTWIAAGKVSLTAMSSAVYLQVSVVTLVGEYEFLAGLVDIGGIQYGFGGNLYKTSIIIGKRTVTLRTDTLRLISRAGTLGLAIRTVAYFLLSAAQNKTK